ncbi:hypothetical protein [Microvirga pudoricolor]|uniref:hypothetical protein n=1 Tax=Microvirga pudoricolor TaxID=2778729 RepID=UPI001950C4A2|nr:hypothetical protein [Microvirga pudoricolor]MBM6592693.1 hypothetical protein [Microvirga pudoricolor]
MESKRFILACLALLPLSLPAMAQAPAAPPGTGPEASTGASQPLRLKVRPSGYEPAPEDAVARQERLLKRMADNDFLFRSICQNCGDAWKHNSYAPFNPMRSLKGMASEPAPDAPASDVAPSAPAVAAQP